MEELSTARSRLSLSGESPAFRKLMLRVLGISSVAILITGALALFASGAMGVLELWSLDHHAIYATWFIWGACAAIVLLIMLQAFLSFKSERERHHAEVGFNDLAACSPEALVVHRHRKIVFANDAACFYLKAEMAGDLFGLSLSQVVRGRATGRRPTDEAARVASKPYEVFIRTLKGDDLIAEATDIELVVGGQWATFTMLRDVTEQRTMRAHVQLSERMASIGTLAAGVAHEINNPLAYVVANLGFVSDSLADPALEIPDIGEIRDALRDARRGAERVRKIVKDLKTFARTDVNKVEPVVLPDVIETSISMVWNEVRHRARLVKDFQPVPVVDGSDGRLGQVFLNLIHNAAQSIPEGHAKDNHIRISTHTDDKGWAVVRILDTGCGIPKELIDKIFDAFYTTKPVGVGTGLGLSICHNIIAVLGGSITVTSVIGKGSSFEVRLPPSSPKNASDSCEDQRAPDVQGKRILVVDDEPMVGVAIKRALAAKNNDVTVETSGRNALQRIAGGGRFDVIFCDLMMPEVTGMDFYDELKRVAPEQVSSIVFITGGAFTERAQEFLDQVPNPRMDKPFDCNQIQQLLAVVLDNQEHVH